MISDRWSCLSAAQLEVDLLMMALCLALTVGFVFIARRHFAAGRNWRGSAMLAAVLSSGATAVLWATCTALGIPPFFVGVVRLPPCDPVHHVVVDPNGYVPTQDAARPRHLSARDAI